MKRPGGSPGYTLVEALLALVLLTAVLAVTQEVLVRQWRFHRLLVELASVRDAGRVALETLASDLRAVSPKLGDLYGIGPDSVALRSTSGLAVVCGAEGDDLRVRRLAGAFGDGRGDSLLAFLEFDPGSALDDRWGAVAVRKIIKGGTGGCPDGRPPDLTLTLSGPLSGAVPGAPVRGFRPYVYRLYRAGDGYWWLGQRLRGGPHQPLAGPFRAPAAGGLHLEYFTAEGRRTETPARVVRVSISVAAHGRRPIPGRWGPQVVTDTMSTHVYLRNGDRSGG
ncbi:MAG: hypothetical protein GWN99_19050 [Gemmatimonadetes bacterium]|uniref:Prepilin-type N-terminal cleavage/methylation domain-containing protein n=1 Tax=Candidatus Kutchimonas denitrificans TaxID=3056748 RepID=A0AAE4Z590_9BACT|nr:hypothetical protein [Gemmatimonadota bacterium]NIR73763.1 hypothetical protein [Candidatus Kutchimonas denitrificans]NIS03127.1 hypothetical protein [Gemmatimonadota bacterium]NIT69028.1 hypothetical protein [Gemmatimonadota bacterium]NIU54119.1 hypothetical protein [Gemmatimonadota bacterium]